MIPAARPFFGQEEENAVLRVLQSGLVAQGPEVASFEREFADTVNGRECIAVNSGTSALHLSLLAAGIGPGDEVIVPSFTFAATANAVALTGARPVFADIEPRYFCLDPDAVRAAITPRTAAVMPVHLYGHPAELTALQAICDAYGLALFEDAAQAHLSSYDGRPVGSWGLAAAFSFYPTKNMTSGEGGMLVTADPQLARRARLLRNQGQAQRYENEIVGLNNRMTDLNAAIGRVQLSRLHGWTRRRRQIAQSYDVALVGVRTPSVRDGASHVYHQYTIRIENGDRDEFARKLGEKGIGSGVYYPIPVHRLPAFDLRRQLPVTEEASRQCLSLPVYPSLTDSEVASVIAAVNLVAAGG